MTSRVISVDRFVEQPMIDVTDKSPNQVSRVASAPGFVAAIARVRGLTPNGTHFDQVTRSVSEGNSGKRHEHSPSLTLRVGKVSAIGPAPLVPVRRAEGRCGAARVPPVHTPEPTVSDLVHVALLRTGYPLHHIRCWSDEETLTLSGFVTRYYYAQIALETALRLANGRRIETHIDVLPAPDRKQWDD